jgi:2-C-methyl-D-erythritol 4-phosphate cytidylyltransferase
MKVAAILLTAGTGGRFNSSLPKQFHLLGNKKLYRHTLDLLKESNLFTSIVCVTKEEFLPYFDADQEIDYVFGGSSRQESVLLGLKALKGIDSVMICESVRPFYTLALLKTHIEKLKNGHVAINTCIPSTDTINIQENNKITKIPKRESFLLGQTPQSFCFKRFLNAHQKTLSAYSDDCAVMLEFNHEISYVTGCKYNIKVTEPNDLILAEVILTKRLSFT